MQKTVSKNCRHLCVNQYRLTPGYLPSVLLEVVMECFPLLECCSLGLQGFAPGQVEVEKFQLGMGLMAEGSNCTDLSMEVPEEIP